MQKQMKQQNIGGRSVKDTPVTLTMCKMKLSQKGSFVRDSPDFEVSLKRSDSYASIIKKAAVALHFEEDVCIDNLVLTRKSGSVLLSEDIGTKQWTLGNYLNSIHMAPDKLKLGIGIQEKESSMKVPSKVGSQLSKFHLHIC